MNHGYPSQSRAWKRSLLFRTIFAILTACAPFAYAAGAAPPFTFRFNPPDGTTYVQTLRTNKTTSLGTLGTRTDVIESRTKVVIAKSPRGYSLVARPLSATMTRDGKKVDNPIFSALSEVVTTYELNPHGQILAVLGFDTLLSKMKASLPPNAPQALSSVFSEEALITKEKAEWNGRIGSFVGRKARIGDVWTSTDRYNLPTGGSIEFYSATKIAGKAKYRGRDCVRVQFAYNSDAGALKSFTGKILKDLARSMKAATVRLGAGSASITGGGERLIDPATMLIYSETLTRTIKLPMVVPGQGTLPATVQEKRAYRFDYGAPARH
jgi:hypothetical protein